VTTLATLTVNVDSDISKLESGFKSASSKMKSFGSAMSSAGTSLTKGLTLPLVGVGVVAAKAFGEAQAVATQTATVLKSTGGAAGVTAKQVSGLATEISNMSGIDDEAVQATENLLLTFKGVQNQAGKNNDIFDQTTVAITDMATAMNGGAVPSADQLKSATIQMGKALNDPVKGLTALTRVGVTFTEQQTKQITAMVKHGETAKAQKVILAELSSEFGGSAEAMGKTANGMMAITKVQLGNAMESLGKVVVTVVLPVIQKLAGWIAQVADWFGNLDAGTKRMIVTVGAIVAAVGPVLIIFGKLTSAIGSVIGVVGKLFSLVMANPWVLLIAATIALVIVIVKNWDTIKAAVFKVWDAIKAAGKAVWDVIKAAVMTVVKVYVTEFNIIKTVVLAVWHAIAAAAKATWDAIRAVWNGVAGFFRGIWNGIKDGASTLWNWLKEAVRDVGHVFHDVWEGVKTFFGNVWTGLGVIARGALNGMIDLINAVIRGINVLISGFNKIPLMPDIGQIPQVPHLARGGTISQTGLAVVHQGETVVPAGGTGITIINQGTIIGGNADDVADAIHRLLLRKQRRTPLGLT
jgi:hypothetical protein